MKQGTGRSYVESHEALGIGAALGRPVALRCKEHGTIVQCQVGTVDKEIHECIVAELQVATIKPDEERGLWAPRFYLRH